MGAVVLMPGANTDIPKCRQVAVVVGWDPKFSPGMEIDASSFLVGADGKVPSDAYFVFYGEQSSPDGSVRFLSSPSTGVDFDVQAFDVDLDKVPAQVEAIDVCVTIHEGQVRRQSFANLKGVFARLVDSVSGREIARFDLHVDGMKETAITLAKVYRRSGQWKFRAVGQGFAGGLAPLARRYGVDVANEIPSPPVSESKVRLEKRLVDLEKKAPHLVSLAKKASASVDKFHLSGTVCRVGLVLDASGSMLRQYQQGRVQEVVDRIFPLAVHFDDDGSLDVWAFAEKSRELTPLTSDSVKSYVDREWGGWQKWMRVLNSDINYEPAVIRAVIDRYRGTFTTQAVQPVYVVFISDGGVGSDKEIEKLLIKASQLPIFWQFVGIGGSNYGILRRFDTMQGRFLDNCNFFSLDDLHSVTDQELYDRLLAEYPEWLKEAAAKGIIRG
ncbi:MAG: VWA domain-containing protein [Magnetococcales bacterium]|nr:VWA domain-containing protein [Magnetococcales bacterium]